MLANHGVALAGIVHDTLLESYVLESHQRHDMDSLATRVLGAKTISYDEVTGTGAKRIGFDQVDIAARHRVCGRGRRHHPAAAPGAVSAASPATTSCSCIYEKIEMPAREVLFRMERNGVLVDADLLSAQSRELGRKMIDLERAHTPKPASPSTSIRPSRSRRSSSSARSCRW